MTTVNVTYMGPSSVMVVDGVEYPQGLPMAMDSVVFARVNADPTLVEAGHWWQSGLPSVDPAIDVPPSLPGDGPEEPPIADVPAPPEPLGA